MPHKGQTRVSCTGGGCGDMLCRVNGNRNTGFTILSPGGWSHVPGRHGKLTEFLEDLLAEHRRRDHCQGTAWHYGPHDDEDQELLESWRNTDHERKREKARQQREADELAKVEAWEENRKKTMAQREVETAHSSRRDQVLAEQRAREDRCGCGEHKIGWCPYPKDEWGDQWVPQASVSLGLYAPAGGRRRLY